MDAPAFEIDDDGYPTDESEEAWEALKPMDVGPHEAASFLLNVLPSIWCYGCSKVTDRVDETTDRPIKEMYFATGGWSGNETIIDLILRQFWVRHFHSKWERGGAYRFEIPDQFFTP